MAPRRPLRSTGSKRDEPKETSVDEVLKDAKEVKFGDETARKAFEDNHRARLSKGGEDSQGSYAQAKDEVLHVIAEKSKPLNKHKDFLEWAIQTHTPLLECKSKNGGGETPLHRAIIEKNHEFVQLVLDNVGVEVLLKHSTDLGESCLHYAIRHSSPFTESIISMASEAVKKATDRNSIDAINAAKSYHPPLGRPACVDFFKAKTSGNAHGYEEMTPLHMAVYMDDDGPGSDSVRSAAPGTPQLAFQHQPLMSMCKAIP
jgi:hypothetical protein